MNIALWIAQGILLLMYLMAGAMKAFQPDKVRQNPQMTWAQDKSEGYIRFIGTAELLGALGMVLPMLTG
ncbi:MAG: DoxX family protein, partial [Anaerolineae bacterium]